jgi:hypothetical protein
MKDIREVVCRPRTIALYASMDLDDYYSVQEVMYVNYDEHYTTLPDRKQREYPRTSYVRISEPVEVGFTGIANDEIVAKAVESLNEQERKTIDELNVKLAAIREKKLQLLALTHQPEPCGHPVGRIGVNADGNAYCGLCGKEITTPSAEVV